MIEMISTLRDTGRKVGRVGEVRLPVASKWIGHGASMDMSAIVPSSAHKGIVAVVGGGRGCQLRTDRAASIIWIPLRGRVQVGNGGDSLLGTGEARVTEADACAYAVGRGHSLWIALLAPPGVWRQVMHGRLGVPAAQAWLFPARYAIDRDLRHRAVALARAVAAENAVEIAVENVLERIAGLQAGFAEAIARCPGRTHAQRRQVFVRLQRVRNYLASNCHLEIDNDELARMANYSPSHFIRAFGSVYQETPHAFLIRQRLERARRLLRVSPLAINEIALESGFENASAFSRLFRQRFGITAGAARKLAASRDAVAA